MVEDEGDESPSNSSPSETTTTTTGSWRYATSFQRDLMAGAVMGGVVHTIVAPIERAKLLLQTQESNMAIVAGKHRKFKGMFDCIFCTFKEEGFLSLWRGNGSSVLRYYPSVALNFSLKDFDQWHCDTASCYSKRGTVLNGIPSITIILERGKQISDPFGAYDNLELETGIKLSCTFSI